MDKFLRDLGSAALSRREAIRLLGGAGIGIAGAGALSAAVGASGGGAGRGWAALQQSATPAAMATPTLGKMADGSMLWHVIVGQMDMANGIEIQSFLPSEITVNEGDSIWFDIGQMPGFHTVTFLNGSKPPAIFLPDSAASPVAGGAPPNQMINPALAFPAGGTSVDGSELVSSGVVLFADPTKPIVYSFPKAGSYDYLCIPHQGVMKAKVVVQKKGSAYPMEQAAYDKMAADEAATIIGKAKADLAKYAKAISTPGSKGATLWEATVGVGEGKGRGQVFLPKDLEIKVGDTVKWVHRAPGEPHTVTFVGGDTQPPEDVIVEPNPNGPPKLLQNNLTLMPQGGNTFSGKGLVSSGWLGVPHLPTDWSCTFDKPGEYIFYCALHGDAKGTGMAGKLKVTK